MLKSLRYSGVHLLIADTYPPGKEKQQFLKTVRMDVRPHLRRRSCARLLLPCSMFHSAAVREHADQERLEEQRVYSAHRL